MNNYFRITAYHPTENISVIMDSNGMFEKLWQFSSFLVQKGFKIIEVGNKEQFLDGDIPKVPPNTKYIFLRACGKEMPQFSKVNINGTFRKIIVVNSISYIQ